ncbi:DUF4752 family protein [Rouxiella sp. Mn2063]|uniref:DUF4752 family protein n=1 Tax=Rouxiella sp. Mn2063 TaxID=3395262 RepID=UPI003BC8D147
MTDISAYAIVALTALGWIYVMTKTGEWLMSIFLKQWTNRRKESRQQKAINELYDAYNLEELKDGSTLKIATRSGLKIFMFRDK